MSSNLQEPFSLKQTNGEFCPPVELLFPSISMRELSSTARFPGKGISSDNEDVDLF